MKPAFIALVLLAAPLAGCVGGSDQPVTPTTVLGATGPNPWEAGLDDHYATPDHAKTRSADARRANVAPPGDPEFAAFDALMEAWMKEHDIPTGTLAIMKDGALRYERGYGTVDGDGTREANASTMMRIASITKPVTGRVVSMMVEEGRLDWHDPVFCVPPDPQPDCLLPLEPHPNRPVVDDRIADITVEHLRDHTGGWATDGPCNDPLWSSGAVDASRTLGVETPAPAWRVVQWLMGAELAHDPGATREYCNAGYVALGAVTEAATGATLEAVMDAYLFRPLDLVGEIEPGRTLPEDRNPREPFYACDSGRTESVYDSNEEVCWPDGGWSMEAMLANGGLVSTAAAVVAVVESMPLEPGGVAIDDRDPDWSFSGSMPGTRANTVVVDDGGAVHGRLQFAVVFNTRTPWEGCDSPLGSVLHETDVPGCSVADVREPLTELVRAWGAADDRAEEGG